MKRLAVFPVCALIVTACQEAAQFPLEIEPALTITGGSPSQVDSDALLPVDFEPVPNLETIQSFNFDINGDGTTELLSFRTSVGGFPAVIDLTARPGVPPGAKALSSKPNTQASLPVTIYFSGPVKDFSFDLLDPQFPTAEVMAQVAGLDLSSSSLGQVIEALNAQGDPRGTVVRAFDASGAVVPVTFMITDPEPSLPFGPDVTSQVTDLTAQGGPVSALSVPGDGNFRGYTQTATFTTINVSVAASACRITRVTISPAIPGTLGVPSTGDFIMVDNIDFPTTVVRSPQELLADLVADVHALELVKGLEIALSATLEAALLTIDSDVPATINQIEAFINQVEALRGTKLTDLEAEGLVTDAQQIIAILSGVTSVC